MDDLSNIRGIVNPMGGMVQRTDINRVVAFYMNRRHNPVKSAEAGSPVYEDQVFFKSFAPGEQRYEVVDRPATRADQQNYPQQYAAFQQNREHVPDGFPIEHLYPLHPSVAATLRGMGVHTVEQCAEMNAHAVDSVMGGQKYQNDAKRFLEMANKSVTASKFSKELEDRDGQIRVLNHTVNELKTQIAELRQSGASPGGVDPALVQAIAAQIQGASGMRPTLPLNPRGKVFDAQTAQINATHATADIAKQRKIRRKAGAN